MLRSAIMAAARNSRIESVVTHAPVSRSVVRRFVGGADTDAAVEVARAILADGRTVTLDHLGEDTADRAQADAATAAYLDLLQALDKQDLTARLGLLTARAEVSVKLSAVGQSLGTDGEHIAFDNARTICVEARRVGATVTLDAEDHTTTDSTLRVLGRLRAEFPETGAVLQAYLRRTESDCRELAHAGSRVRLCKGAYAEPESVAYQDRADVDRSYVRCANVLLAGGGYPMFATHDPTIIDILGARVAAHGRSAADVEYQMLYGIRPDEQKRLAAAGNTVRVYVPYGAQWYGYLMRRLAERPANLAFFARALVSKG
jgi:proline dehydrogenase